MIRLHEGFLVLTSHDFKTNFSKYLKMLQEGAFPGIVVCKYDRCVGVFRPIKRQKMPRK